MCLNFGGRKNKMERAGGISIETTMFSDEYKVKTSNKWTK